METVATPVTQRRSGFSEQIAERSESAAMWDALQSIDALSDMPRHVVRAYVRSATEGWPRDRARRFTHMLHRLIQLRRGFGVIEAYPPGGRPRRR